MYTHTCILCWCDEIVGIIPLIIIILPRTSDAHISRDRVSSLCNITTEHIIHCINILLVIFIISLFNIYLISLIGYFYIFVIYFLYSNVHYNYFHQKELTKSYTFRDYFRFVTSIVKKLYCGVFIEISYKNLNSKLIPCDSTD